ncbi:hypothetical protein [Longispora albida]|uniref:hypothetical protein n=1 Tax=Longispora albida TaxID=203523 RepID=UPI0012FCF6EB|nr:hypothetical protein [Longispora albida]
MASTVRPSSTLIVGLSAGVFLGAALPLLAAVAGLLSWPGGGGVSADARPRALLAAVAVFGAALLARRFGGRGLSGPFGAAIGGLVAVPIASSAAAWSQLYGAQMTPARAGTWAALGVVCGGIFALLAQRVPQPLREEWRFRKPREETVGWPQLDVQVTKVPVFSLGSEALSGRGLLLSRDVPGHRPGPARGQASPV